MAVFLKNWFGLNAVQDKDLADLSQRDLLMFAGFELFVRGLGLLSLKQGEKWGKRLGSLWFMMDKVKRKMVLDNLETAYGKQLTAPQKNNLAKKVFENSARMIFEYAWYYARDLDEILKFFQIKGIENLHRAHAKGKGIIALSGHLGNFELASYLGTLSGYTLSVVYRKIKTRGLDLLVMKNRIRYDCKMYPLHSARGHIIDALGQGHIVALLCDQNSSRSRGVFVDFFDKKACTHAGVARLIRDTRSPVVPIFTYKEKGRFVIEIQPELKLSFTADETDDILTITQQCQVIIEKMVRRYPEQWFWIHQRWKRRPKDEITGKHPK